jgi:hypothetical protein
MESETERREQVNKLNELSGKGWHLWFGTAISVEKRVC